MTNPVLSLTDWQRRSLSETLVVLNKLINSGHTCQFKDSTGIDAVNLYTLLTKLQTIDFTLEYLGKPR